MKHSKSFAKWFNARPKIIQDAIITRPPKKLYKIKNTGDQCYIISYAEPEVGEKAREMFKEVTVTVQKTGKKQYKNEAQEFIHKMDIFRTCRVFGIKLDDLEEWSEE